MGLKGILGKALGLVPGSNAVKAIASILPDLVETPQQKAAARETANAMLANSDKVQGAINQAEAGHRSVFVAGWRPFLGWVGGFSLGYPAFRLMAGDLAHLVFGHQLPPLSPDYNAYVQATIAPMIMGMLGLIVARTAEKRMGLTK